jgi:hypothetical protein
MSGVYFIIGRRMRFQAEAAAKLAAEAAAAAKAAESESDETADTEQPASTDGAVSENG